MHNGSDPVNGGYWEGDDEPVLAWPHNGLPGALSVVESRRRIEEADAAVERYAEKVEAQG